MATGEDGQGSPPRFPPTSLSRQRSGASFQASLTPSPSRQPRWPPLEHAQSLDSGAWARMNSSPSPGSSTLARSPSIARSRTGKFHDGVSGLTPPPSGGSGSGSVSMLASPESTGTMVSQGSRKKLLRTQSSFSLRGLDPEGVNPRKRRAFHRKAVKVMVLVSLFIVFFFVCDWLALGYLRRQGGGDAGESFVYTTTRLDGQWSKIAQGKKHTGVMYERVLALAAHALAEAESEVESEDLWEEAAEAGAWKPCADQGIVDYPPLVDPSSSSGYIVVSANGGLNQQRVAVCNSVAVARLLNATLVLPGFLFNSVWMDDSQFGDIYDEDYFMDYLKGDVHIVKELPVELRSLDLAAMGSLVTDFDIEKEAKPSFYVNNILPILLKNRVVHFQGFGNRLSFDPIPFEVQRLRCRCNFHALRFVPRLLATSEVLIHRIRNYQDLRWGNQSWDVGGEGDLEPGPVKYLGLHLRFEMDMVAHSRCEFGGGESERKELEAFRELHFPGVADFKESQKKLSAAKRRELGWCPLTPEETVVMLAALGFKRRTRMFLAGASIYGGASRMAALTSMYPNLVSKEELLTPEELAPFKSHSSQLAALDFIACVAADVFAMSDSGSQLASLVAGQRVYHGGGKKPTIRPNKKRLAAIFSQSATIEWEEFRERVRTSVRQTRRTDVRPKARSVYRYPRCPECMCLDPGSRPLPSSNTTEG